MDYAKKKKLKLFLKDIDLKYLGGLLQRLFRGNKKRSPVEKQGYSIEEKQAAAQEIMRQVRLPLPNDSTIKRVEIIVLKYKDPEVEVECAKRILENTEWPYKMNFYDNRPGTKNMAKIWNKLIRESTCDYVALMDSDAFVPNCNPCWLTHCMKVFEAHSDCYIVSPMLDRIGFDQQRAVSPKNKPPEKIVDLFANTCMVFKKSVFEKVGYYDEEFLFYGADPEWAWRFLHFNGVEGYLLPDVVVRHEHHYSAKKATQKKEFDWDVEKEYTKNLYQKKTSEKS